MKNYYFQAEHLWAGYNRKPIVRELEFRLPKGEILSLIGPNGAGKSTVLKSIAGQLGLIEGVVYLGEDSLSELGRKQLAKRMSVLFTEKPKGEMMTCRDMVATGRYPYTGRFGVLSPKDMCIVDEAMEMVHIAGMAELDFNKASDGQKQRVMLARAMCQEPEIVILDEPTSYLDVKHKLEFLSVLQDMKEKKGLTVIMSLHELELAKRISDKVLCLKDGYAGKYGTPEEIFSHGYIEELFDIREGSFDQESGSVELRRPKGRADLFVIAGGGQGRDIYYRLQREGRPFATGILYDNDLDYPAARSLAAQVIGTKAFETVEEGTICRARQIMDACGQVICCRENIGSLDLANRELMEYAREKGMYVKGYYGSGNYVRCGKEPSCGWAVQDYEPGRVSDGSL